MSEQEVDHRKRRFLTNVTTGIGLVGTAFAATPFVLSMVPSARARAAGAPVEVDVGKLEDGQMLTVEWRGKPVWIVKRTPEMLAGLQQDVSLLADPDSKVATQQPAYAQNPVRSIKPELLVLVGVCTHLGCSPLAKLDSGPVSGVGDDWPGGFFCPCHGSKFDLAGRVFKGVPAPTNLVVPPYSYISDTRVVIGTDKDNKGVA
ncbi:MAG TPA: ubiquinol-cytochrome c reductase iron-sulfur subunit [Acidiferrobacterales bacterium]|nr:ubiquinol-cytochrome c reductase iron-sulfur subunit [Acidiferrobacterales bacterium]